MSFKRSKFQIITEEEFWQQEDNRHDAEYGHDSLQSAIDALPECHEEYNEADFYIVEIKKVSRAANVKRSITVKVEDK